MGEAGAVRTGFQIDTGNGRVFDHLYKNRDPGHKVVWYFNQESLC